MNERIKELWEQAAKTTQGDSWEEQTKFMEKFAELIVGECIEWTKGNGGLNAECDYDALKEYFGVEQ